MVCDNSKRPLHKVLTVFSFRGEKLQKNYVFYPRTEKTGNDFKRRVDTNLLTPTPQLTIFKVAAGQISYFKNSEKLKKFINWNLSLAKNCTQCTGPHRSVMNWYNSAATIGVGENDMSAFR